MPQLSDAFGLSAAGRRLDGRPLLLRLLAVQPRGRRGDGPAGAAEGGPDWRGGRRHRGAAVRDGQQRRRRASDVSCRARAASFALVGAVYIATTSFPPSRAATLIGATQMFGMAGGSAGQFVVGPMIGRRPRLEHVLGRHGHRWRRDGRDALRPAAGRGRAAAEGLAGHGRPCAAHRLPEPAVDPVRHHRGPALHPDDDLRHGVGRALPAGCARNRLRRGRDAVGDGARSAGSSAARCSGSSRTGIGRRKPVIVGGALRAARLPRVDPVRVPGVFPPYVVGLVAGIASGAAMLPYTVSRKRTRRT